MTDMNLRHVPKTRTRTITLLGVMTMLALVYTACGKPTADEHLKRAEEYLQRNDTSAAILELRSALQVDGNRGDVRLKLADAYMRTQDLPQALQQYVRAADLLPNDATAQIKAGTLLLAAGSTEDARARALKAIAADPKSTDAQIFYGNTLAGLKDLDGALAEYQRVVALDPSKDTAAVNLGIVQIAKGQKTEAEATFRKAIVSAPKAVSPRLALANFLWSDGRRDDAERTLKEVLTIEPEGFAVNRALGVFYMTSGRIKEAEPYFQTIARAANTPQAKIGLADYYLLVEKPDEARKILTELAQGRPEDFVLATTRLAAIDAGMGQRAQALDKLRTVLEKNPKDAAARLLSARVLLIDRKPEEALAEATRLTTDRPDAPEAAAGFLIVGSVNAEKGLLVPAEAAYKETLKRQPGAVAAVLALAGIAMRQGDPEGASSYVTQALAASPAYPPARSASIRLAVMKKDMARARTELAALSRDFPRSVEVLNLEAGMAAANGQHAAAQAAFLKVLEIAPGNPEALTGLTALDFTTGRSKEALTRLEGAAKTAGPASDVALLTARGYIANRNWEQAEAILLKALDAEPGKLLTYQLLARVYLAQRRLQDALDRFRQVIERDPTSVGTATMIGMLLETLDRKAEAEKQYRATLAIDSTAPVAANNLAWLFVSTGRNLDEAVQLAQTAKRKLPDQPQVNDTLGWAYYHKKMMPQAIRYLEESVAKDATDPSVHYHLGMAYAANFETLKARASLTKALSFNTSFQGIDEAKATLAKLK